MIHRLQGAILVCGAPGVGKSHLIEASRGDLADLTLWDADEIIAHTDPMMLDALDLDPDFASPHERAHCLLACAFQARLPRISTTAVVLEIRSLIETATGLFEIPLRLIASLQPIGLVHVEEDCERVQDRCIRDRTRLRLSRSVIQLARWQHRSFLACSEYARHLNCHLECVPAGAREHFVRAIRSMVTSSIARASG